MLRAGDAGLTRITRAIVVIGSPSTENRQIAARVLRSSALGVDERSVPLDDQGPVCQPIVDMS